MAMRGMSMERRSRLMRTHTHCRSLLAAKTAKTGNKELFFKKQKEHRQRTLCSTIKSNGPYPSTRTSTHGADGFLSVRVRRYMCALLLSCKEAPLILSLALSRNERRITKEPCHGHHSPPTQPNPPGFALTHASSSPNVPCTVQWKQ